MKILQKIQKNYLKPIHITFPFLQMSNSVKNLTIVFGVCTPVYHKMFFLKETIQ